MTSQRLNWQYLFYRWAPVALWASFILFFSSGHFSSSNTSQILGPLLQWFVPAISVQQIELIHFLIRKFAHWANYFVLGALTMRAFYNPALGTWEKRHVLWTILIILVLASADEFHQAFVPARSASAVDVMIDLFGGICGALFTCLLYGVIFRTPRQRSISRVGFER
jgi:VanZ family protein